MASIKHKAGKLPPLKSLRVKDTRAVVENPCVLFMSQLLSCWASRGQNAMPCVPIETELRKCMDGPAPPAPYRNPINENMMRFQKHVTQKKKYR